MPSSTLFQCRPNLASKAVDERRGDACKLCYAASGGECLDGHDSCGERPTRDGLRNRPGGPVAVCLLRSRPSGWSIQFPLAATTCVSPHRLPLSYRLSGNMTNWSFLVTNISYTRSVVSISCNFFLYDAANPLYWRTLLPFSCIVVANLSIHMLCYSTYSSKTCLKRSINHNPILPVQPVSTLTTSQTIVYWTSEGTKLTRKANIRKRTQYDFFHILTIIVWG